MVKITQTNKLTALYGKCRLTQSDPISCGMQFNFSVSKFLSDCILSKFHLIAKVEDFLQGGVTTQRITIYPCYVMV